MAVHLLIGEVATIVHCITITKLMAPPEICSRQIFKIYDTKEEFIFHVNQLLADGSHEMSSLIFPQNE